MGDNGLNAVQETEQMKRARRDAAAVAAFVAVLREIGMLEEEITEIAVAWVGANGLSDR